MPEETGTAGAAGTPPQGQESLASRLDRLEREVLMENRWWRGGLIAALIFLALSISITGLRHHRHRPSPPAVAAAPMGMPGWSGMPRMPYGQFGPYFGPPPWGFAPQGPCGCRGYGRRGFHRWSFQRWSGPSGPGVVSPQGPPAPPKG